MPYLHSIFHHLRFDWHSFNDVILLQPHLKWFNGELVALVVCLHAAYS